MKLRLSFSDWLHLRHARILLKSAKSMRLSSFFACCLASFFLHALILFSSGKIFLSFPLLLASAISAGGSYLFIPKRFAYATHHLFFLRKSRDSFLSHPVAAKPIFKEETKQFDLRIDLGERPHFVFLFLESFRAHSIDERVTPHFHQLKKKGLYFSHFYSNGTLTYRALLSGLFGVMPASTSVGLSPYLDLPLQGVPEFFKKRGYKRAFHHNGSLRFDFQDQFLQKHFDAIADLADMGGRTEAGWGIADEELMRYSANWLGNQTESAFLTMFTISNHHPWIVPKHYEAPSGFSRFEQTMHYTDYALSVFLEELKRRNLLSKTVLFILGDHGQPQGEHEGNFYNSRFLYEENIRIPLLILAEGRIVEGEEVKEPSSQIDLFPTVLDLFQSPLSGEGVSLLRKRDVPVFFQNPYSEGYIGCRKGVWKWIENRFSGEEELYDLEKDPKETKDLSASRPEIANALKQESHAFFSQVEEQYQKIPRKGALSPYILDLSDSLISDEQLIEQGSPQWVEARLNDCLLLTDKGIGAFLAKSSQLEELQLKGISEIGDALFLSKHRSLRVLDLSDAPSIDPEKIVRSFPALQELSFNAKQANHLPFRGLIRLKLFEADLLTDESIFLLSQNNPHLTRLAIYGGKSMTDEGLYALSRLPLEQLWIYGASSFTPTALREIKGRSIRSLIINGIN